LAALGFFAIDFFGLGGAAAATFNAAARLGGASGGQAAETHVSFPLYSLLPSLLAMPLCVSAKGKLTFCHLIQNASGPRALGAMEQNFRGNHRFSLSRLLFTPASGTQGAPGLRAWLQWEVGTLGNGDRADHRAEFLSFLCRSAKNLVSATPLILILSEPHASLLMVAPRLKKWRVDRQVKTPFFPAR
jgi:hypothetical protein